MKKITVKGSQVRPSQDWLREDTVRYILACYAEHRESELPPPPLVRHNPETRELVAIDGHNLLAVADFLGKEIEVYAVDSSEDRMVENNVYRKDMVEKRNAELAEKFDSSLRGHEDAKAAGINSFVDLRNKYAYLWTS